jgi:hypothetical protein
MPCVGREWQYFLHGAHYSAFFGLPRIAMEILVQRAVGGKCFTGALIEASRA